MGANPSLGNEQLVGGVAKDDDNMLDALAACRQGASSADVNRCLKESAISYNQIRFCELAGNDSARGDCVIKVATQTSNLRPELCQKAGPMKSECYANVAYLKQDASYCQMVEDAALKAQCLNMTAARGPLGGNASSGANATAPANASKVVGASQK